MYWKTLNIAPELIFRHIPTILRDADSRQELLSVPDAELFCIKKDDTVYPARDNDYYIPVELVTSYDIGYPSNFANHRFFLDKFDVPGVVQAYGKNNYKSVAIRLDAIIPEMLPCISNEVLDAESLLDIQEEARDDAWHDWIEYAFVNALGERMEKACAAGGVPAHKIKALLEMLEDIDDERLRKIFESAVTAAQLEWEYEKGAAVYIDTDEAAAWVKAADLTA